MLNVERYDAVNRWIQNYPSETKEKYLPYLERLIEYSGSNPEALLTLGRETPEKIDDLINGFYYERLEPEEPSLLERRLIYAFLRNFWLLNGVKVFHSVYGVCPLERYHLLGMTHVKDAEAKAISKQRETTKKWIENSSEPVVKNYGAVRNWLEKFPVETIENYLEYFKMMLEFTGLNPDELIEWGRKDEVEIGMKLNDIYRKLVEDVEPIHTRTLVFTFLRGFFIENGIAPGEAPHGYGACFWERYYMNGMRVGPRGSPEDYEGTKKWLEASNDELVRKYESVRRWLEDYPLETVEKYFRYFEPLVEYSGMDPTELLEKAQEAPQEIDILLDNYYHDRLEKDVPELSTRAVAHMFVRTFFTLNGKQLDLRETDRPHKKEGGLSYRYCFFETWRVLGSKALGQI